MLKHVVIAAALTTFGAATVYGQTQPAPMSSATTVRTDKDEAMNARVTADTRKLIGRNVKNMQGETIGEIESIHVSNDGKIASVIVGVGGFLGIGERHARVAWKDLKIENGGELVTVNMTKDQLNAMESYNYKDPGYRGQMYTDTGLWKDGVPADRRVDNRTPTTDNRADNRQVATDNRTATDRTLAPRATTSRDWNTKGHISAESVLKASVRNSNNEKVGEIEDVYLDEKGQIQNVIVSVGGFLGMGSKHVEVNWKDLQIKKEGDNMVIVSNWTMDSLKSLPDYKYERQQAAQPPAERK